MRARLGVWDDWFSIATSRNYGVPLFNKKLIKISTNLEEINPKSGIAHYGKVKNTFILIKGSIPGPKKRLIVLTQPIRSKKKISQEKPIIEYINKK